MLNLKSQSIIFAVLGGFLVAILPMSVQAANTSAIPANGDPNALVCVALADILPCGTPAPIQNKSTSAKPTTTANSKTSSGTTPTTSSPVSISSILGAMFGLGSSSGSTSSNRNLTSNISQGFLGKTQKNFAVVLVKAPNRPEIYRLIGGKKFLIPNDTVFDSYGYTATDIKIMSWTKIMAYPRVKLIKLDSDTSVYYLTEGGMTRIIPNQTIFNSYADGDEDVVVVNKTEFSMYPQNKYIFNESTYTASRKPNVYLVGGGTKKLIFPDQLTREGITDAMIAPVNQTEFDYYVIALAVTPTQRTWFNWF